MNRTFALVGVSFFLIAAAALGAKVPLHIKVLDDSTKAPVPARVYLSRDGNPILPQGFQIYQRRSERHFLVTGDFTLDLEPGQYELRLERGLEYQPVEAHIRVEEETTQSFTLKRWVKMSREGWYSADMHVHRNPAADAKRTMGTTVSVGQPAPSRAWS